MAKNDCYWVNSAGEHVVRIVPWDEDHVESFIIGLGPGHAPRVIEVWGEHRLIFAPERADEATYAKLAFC